MNTKAGEANIADQSRANANPVSGSRETEAFAFEDNRPEAIVQRKLQEMANNSLQVAAHGRLSQQIHNSPRMVAQHQYIEQIFVPSKQREAMAEEKHGVLAEEPIQRTETLSIVQREDLEESFKPGDKLYGLEEEARAIRRPLIEARKVAGNHPTIDSINNAFQLLGGSKRLTALLENIESKLQTSNAKLAPEWQEIYDYGKFLVKARSDLTQGSDFDDLYKNIRKSCKAALVYYSQNAAIHFDLQGIDPNQVIAERGRKEPGITGVEMRALMRQVMRDQNIIPARVEEKQSRGNIDLANVHFYLNGKRVDAPWVQPLQSEWRKAWQKYIEVKTPEDK